MQSEFNAAHLIEVDDLQVGYKDIVDRIMNYGKFTSPRGQRTLEIGPVTIAIMDPRRCVPLGTGRKLNLAIGAAESCQLVGGVSDAAQMVSITKNFAQFVEDGRLRGAYGPRVHGQFPRVVELLKRDPDSRQAGVVIWRPDELAVPSADVPCTVELHFQLRGGRLNMFVTMRSNDVFWGLPYDAWMFSSAMHAVAWALGAEVGTYYHTALSLHAYERDADKLALIRDFDASEAVAAVPMLTDGMSPPSAAPWLAWDLVSLWARIACLSFSRAVLDRIRDEHDVMPVGVRWYYEALAPHASGGFLCPRCRYVTADVCLCDVR